MAHFIKIWEKKLFWQIEAKMRMRMEKIGKMSLIFEFSTSKLGYIAIFMKIWEKISCAIILRRSIVWWINMIMTCDEKIVLKTYWSQKKNWVILTLKD